MGVCLASPPSASCWCMGKHSITRPVAMPLLCWIPALVLLSARVHLCSWSVSPSTLEGFVESPFLRLSLLDQSLDKA